MLYIEFDFHIYPENEIVKEILPSSLVELGFESFTESKKGIKGYIPVNLYTSYTKEKIPNKMLGSDITYSCKDIPEQNWNKEWEDNYYSPIIVSEECVVHSSAHKKFPKVKYDIIINPRLAFGTGYHETTNMLLSEIIKSNLKNKSFLDMGCGTAVLSILASKKGANRIYGIDIDSQACDNAMENCKLNNADIKIFCGGAEKLKEIDKVDFIVANINRNILLKDMSFYADKLKAGGTILFSGFYADDIPYIEEKARTLNLQKVHNTEKNNWVVVRFEKVQ